MGFDIGLLGKLVAGAVVGLVGTYFVWKKLNESSLNEVKAADRSDWIQGGLDAVAQEKAALKAEKDSYAQPKDELDW